MKLVILLVLQQCMVYESLWLTSINLFDIWFEPGQFLLTKRGTGTWRHRFNSTAGACHEGGIESEGFEGNPSRFIFFLGASVKILRIDWLLFWKNMWKEKMHWVDVSWWFPSDFPIRFGIADALPAGMMPRPRERKRWMQTTTSWHLYWGWMRWDFDPGWGTAVAVQHQITVPKKWAQCWCEQTILLFFWWKIDSCIRVDFIHRSILAVSTPLNSCTGKALGTHWTWYHRWDGFLKFTCKICFSQWLQFWIDINCYTTHCVIWLTHGGSIGELDGRERAFWSWQLCIKTPDWS